MTTSICNRAQLATNQGVSLVTVDNWVRAGCPVVQRGARGVEWQFDNAAVTKWRLDQVRNEAGGDEKQQEMNLRKRKSIAETMQAELTLAKEMGLVAPVDQVERMLAATFATVRTNIRNIPGRVVSRLIGETDERRFKAVLLEEIDTALESLATVDLAAIDDVDQDDDAAAG